MFFLCARVRLHDCASTGLMGPAGPPCGLGPLPCGSACCPREIAWGRLWTLRRMLVRLLGREPATRCEPLRLAGLIRRCVHNVIWSIALHRSQPAPARLAAPMGLIAPCMETCNLCIEKFPLCSAGFAQILLRLLARWPASRRSSCVSSTLCTSVRGWRASRVLAARRGSAGASAIPYLPQLWVAINETRGLLDAVCARPSLCCSAPGKVRVRLPSADKRKSQGLG